MAKGESRRGGGFLTALLGLSALAVVAFVAGGIAGLLWKEPGLLVAYMRGDTTEFAWSTASRDVAPAEPPPVAAAPVAGAEAKETPPAAKPVKPAPKQAKKPVVAAKPPAKPKPKPAAAAKPAPKLPDVAARPAADGARIAIQVGAFAERAGAEALRGELAADGYPAYVAPGASSGNARWRVRVGPYPERAKADAVAATLKRTRKLPTWVLNEGAE